MDNKNNYKGWLYLFPAIILIVIFTIYPIINTFYISFLEDYNFRTGANTGFTFDNYGVILGFTEFPDYITGKGQVEAFLKYALPNTLLIALVTVPISIFLSLIVAVLLNQIKVLRRLFQTVFFVPYVTNIIAIGMVFGVIFSSNGLINDLFNIDISWMPSPGGKTSYWAAMFVLFVEIIWYEMPFKILIFLGGLQGIDKQYYEAARIDSTPYYKKFFRITVPLLSPQILYVSITSFIDAFKEYQAIAGLFGNMKGTDSLSYNLYTCVYFIYDQVQTGGRNINYACAAAVVLFVIILLFTLLQYVVSKKRVYY